MKLLYRITLRISVALLILFAVWGTLFYFIIIDEINDETDDSLEDYSEYIIAKALAGEKLPEKDNGTNNSYHIAEVDKEYAKHTPSVRYSDETVYIYSKKETEPARIYKTIFKDRDGRYFELTVMIPSIEKEDLQKTILYWIIALYVLLLLAIIAINAIVLRQSLKPLYTLLAWSDNLVLGKDIPPITMHNGISEFNKLSASLMRGAQRNAEIYEQQSLFIGHASHELQTPLAIAKNRLELLANESGLTESQLEQIVKTQRSLDDIVKLNKTLLLLTRIENKQFPDNSEVNINDLLFSLSDDFTEAYAYAGITCNVENNFHLTVWMNNMLASVLFSNLIKNAFVHNQKGGKVTIACKRNSIIISNTATAGALNPDYIFRRFYRGQKEGSTGLGLSLVESISKLYNIKVSYSYEDGMHVFTIKFPEFLIRHSME